jgi:hypothetical protein
MLWGAVILTASSGLAMIVGAKGVRVGVVGQAIVDVSAWYHVFEEGPPESSVYVGCDLRDGSYVGGQLDWYSTQVSETADRDFVLAEPITFRPPDSDEDRTIVGFSRLVLSARDVGRLYVAYIENREARSAS